MRCTLMGLWRSTMSDPMAAIDPKDVREHLDRMFAGDSSPEILAVLVAAAEAYAEMKIEWGFESPQTGLYYSTRNDMLIETLHAGRPEAELLARVSSDWVAFGYGEDI